MDLPVGKTLSDPCYLGIILAVAAEPLIVWVAKKMGGRRLLAAILSVLIIFAAPIIPTVMLVVSSVEKIQVVSAQMQAKTLTIPPPPESVIGWPLIGESLQKAWLLASTNLAAALKQFAPR